MADYSICFTVFILDKERCKYFKIMKNHVVGSGSGKSGGLERGYSEQEIIRRKRELEVSRILVCFEGRRRLDVAKHSAFDSLFSYEQSHPTTRAPLRSA